MLSLIGSAAKNVITAAIVFSVFMNIFFSVALKWFGKCLQLSELMVHFHF